MNAKRQVQKKAPSEPKPPKEGPDRKKSVGHIGGNLAEVPLPHVRFFPFGNYRRKVIASISSYRGISIGAKHFYANLREDDNPIWDTTVNGWRCCWDDPEGRGLELEQSVFTRKEAEEWIVETFRDKFSTKTHKLVDRNWDVPTWLRCLREGD